MRVYNYGHSSLFMSLLIINLQYGISSLIQTKNDAPVLDVIVQTIMNIMTICYPEDLDKVVLVGDSVDFPTLHPRFPQNLSINIVGLSESEMFERHKRLKGVYKITEDVVQKLRYPAAIFVIYASVESLNQTLQQGKRSVFWNAEAIFFIALTNVDESCSDAKYFLRDVWSFNALYAFYVCGRGDTIYFYSFNPFTAYALESWEAVDSINDIKRNHPITIFRFPVNFTKVTSTTCASLNFAKTYILDDYPVAVAGAILPGMLSLSPTIALHSRSRYNVTDFVGIDAIITKEIWRRLGAQVHVTIFKEGYVDPLTYEPRGSLEYIVRGEYDIGINQYYFRSFWRLETYPHGNGGTCIIMKEAAMSVAVFSMPVEPGVTVGIIVGVAVAVVLLKYLVEFDWVNSMLAVLKMLLGMPTKHHPPTITKLYVVFLIFLLNGINLYLQSNLTSSLAAPSGTFLIDSREDLISAMYDYDIYGPPYVKEFFDNEELNERLVEMSIEDCIERLAIDVNVICVCDSFLINHHAKHCHDCHISKHNIQNNLLSFIHREDWPLKTRFNTMVSRLSESGIVTKILKDRLTEVTGHRKMHESKAWPAPAGEEGEAKKINLEELEFNFRGLLAGTAMAGLVFLGEIVVQWKGWMGRRRMNKINLRNLKLFN